MPRRTVTLALIALLLGARAAAPNGAVALPFSPCPMSQGFSCASLSVPLDRGDLFQAQ